MSLGELCVGGEASHGGHNDVSLYAATVGHVGVAAHGVDGGDTVSVERGEGRPATFEVGYGPVDCSGECECAVHVDGVSAME